MSAILDPDCPDAVRGVLADLVECLRRLSDDGPPDGLDGEAYRTGLGDAVDVLEGAHDDDAGLAILLGAGRSRRAGASCRPHRTGAYGGDLPSNVKK